jgi:hypothetical protein
MRRVYSDSNYDFLTIRCVDLNDIKPEIYDIKLETDDVKIKIDNVYRFNDEANKTEANKTEANKTEANKIEVDKFEVNKVEADKTKKFGTIKLQVYHGPYKDNDPFLFLHSEIYNTYFSKNYKVLLDIGLYTAYIFHCSRKLISLLTKALVNYSSIRPFSETFSYYLKRASIECVFGDFCDGLF